MSGNAITVSDNKITRTFVMTQFTEINVNGLRATAADLKPGMVVNVTIGTDPYAGESHQCQWRAAG